MTRTPLPNRRPHELFDFIHWGTNYTVGIGTAGLNAPTLEIWLNCGKSGTQLETLARDSAVLISLALQHGTPLEAMRHSVTRDPDGTPSGPIGKLLDIMGQSE